MKVIPISNKNIDLNWYMFSHLPDTCHIVTVQKVTGNGKYFYAKDQTDLEKLFGYADCTKENFMEVIKTGDSGTWTGKIVAWCSEGWGEKKVNSKAGDWLPGDQIKSKACSLGIYQN